MIDVQDANNQFGLSRQFLPRKSKDKKPKLAVVSGLIILVALLLLTGYFLSAFLNKKNEIDSNSQAAVSQSDENMTQSTDTTETVASDESIQLPIMYTVKEGDTLLGLSQKFYNSVDYATLIIEFNGIKDNNVLKVGTQLIIPPISAKIPSTVQKETNITNPSIQLPTTHTVKEGETLQKISQKYYNSVDYVTLITEYNSLKDNNVLKAGTKLVIPPASTKIPSTVKKETDITNPSIQLPTTHTVKEGDTLQKISQKYYNSVDYVALITEYNSLKDNNVLKAGTKLVIPSASTKIPSTVKEEADAANQPVQLPTTYTVKEGDTLQGISQKFYNSVDYMTLITEYNNIKDNNVLKAGTKLELPLASTKIPSTVKEETEAANPSVQLPTTYAVKEGDTLRRISQKFYNSVNYTTLIAEYNGIKDNNVLKAGMQLMIPSIPTENTTTKEQLDMD